ncbi:YigZ family protein [Paracoccus zhouxuedongae]|uniref:YigZ family protein n=1 Tax=Paracoccus sp. p3-h83 TaxID=3342805 RepID=UPI0035BBBAB7
MLDKLLSDRGSRYAVTVAPAATRAQAQAVVAELCRKGKFRRATHHSWALLTPTGEPIGDDDGEAGAWPILRAELEAAGLHGHVVIVTRWFGGTHLGGDRFRHLRTAARAGVEAWMGQDQAG